VTRRTSTWSSRRPASPRSAMKEKWLGSGLTTVGLWNQSVTS